MKRTTLVRSKSSGTGLGSGMRRRRGFETRIGNLVTAMGAVSASVATMRPFPLTWAVGVDGDRGVKRGVPEPGAEVVREEGPVVTLVGVRGRRE